MKQQTTTTKERVLEALFDQQLAGVYVIQDGRFKYVNQQFAQLFGYDSPEDIIEKLPIEALVDESDVLRVLDNVRKRADGEVGQMHYCFLAKRRNGSTMSVEVHGTAMHLEGRRVVTGLLLDVTEQRSMEARIEARDRKFQKLFNASIIGMVCWDANGMILDANHAFLDMLGLNLADVERGVHWQSITPVEYHAECARHVQEIMQHGFGTPNEKAFLHRDGRWVPALVNGIRVDDCLYAGISFVLDMSRVQEVEQEKNVLFDMMDKAPIAIFVQDARGRFTYFNETGRSRLREIAGEITGKSEKDFMSRESARKVGADRRRIMKSGVLEQFEEKIWFKGESEPCYYRTTKWPLFDANGKAVSLAGVAVPITKEKKAEAEVASLNKLINSVFDNMPFIAILKDVDGAIISTNQRFSEVFGVPSAAVLGKKLWQVIPGFSRPIVREHDAEVLRSGQPFAMEIMANLHERKVPFMVNAFPVENADGVVNGICTLIHDLSEAKRAEQAREALQQAEFESMHDILTGLPNRRLLLERIEGLLEGAEGTDLGFTLLFIDLDDFKQINDRLGHLAGDELLQVLARRMLACIRDTDTLARVGGDEFIVLLTDAPDDDDVAHVINRLLSAVSQRVILHEGDVMPSCSIGYAAYPEDGTDIDTLMKQADSLMYRMKQRRRNQPGPND